MQYVVMSVLVAPSGALLPNNRVYYVFNATPKKWKVYQFSAHKCLVLPNKRHCSAVCGSHRVIGFAGLPLDVYQPDQPTITVINYKWFIMIYLTVLDLEGICRRKLTRGMKS